MTLQRPYRANLCRDIKYRRITGALLTPPRGTDSLSIRCLDTCCFLARQLHVTRTPWIIVSSSRNNIWSYPFVRQLFTLSNTWAMTTDLCGYGDKWRKRTGFLMGWIDSRDRRRFAKQCSTTQGGHCSLSQSQRFSRCPPSQCSTYPALFVDALAFVLSTSAENSPPPEMIRDSCLVDVV